jgi:hypothetical protein
MQSLANFKTILPGILLILTAIVVVFLMGAFGESVDSVARVVMDSGVRANMFLGSVIILSPFFLMMLCLIGGTCCVLKHSTLGGVR